MTRKFNNHITVRCTEEFIERIDKYHKKLEKSTGITVARGEVIRSLIEKGLKEAKI